jgi:hypothetical protein
VLNQSNYKTLNKYQTKKPKKKKGEMHRAPPGLEDKGSAKREQGPRE